MHIYVDKNKGLTSHLPPLLSTVSFGQGIIDLTDSLDSMVSPLGSTSFYSPTAGVLIVHAWLFLQVLGLELRSSGQHGEHFTDSSQSHRSLVASKDSRGTDGIGNEVAQA